MFLNAELNGDPYSAPEFRETLRGVVDPTDIKSWSQHQMSLVWTAACATTLTNETLLGLKDISVRDREFLTIDPGSREV